jgi:hypothetical protein
MPYPALCRLSAGVRRFIVQRAAATEIMRYAPVRQNAGSTSEGRVMQSHVRDDAVHGMLLREAVRGRRLFLAVPPPVCDADCSMQGNGGPLPPLP